MAGRLRVIFIGTPDFAVASLKALVENGCQVVAVITAPDKPAGRGLQLQESAVKQYAVKTNIPVLQPTNLKNPEFLEEVKQLRADLQIVIAFRMMPVALWDMPPLGTFNLHASLLPQYRGAAPINWAIINGEKETGISTFFLKHEIDTGHIVFQEKVAIGPDMTAGELHDELMNRGATLVVKTWQAVEAGNYPESPQSNADTLKHAPKIFREHCEIRWDQPVQKIHDHIRGLSPYPAAFTQINGLNCKIYKAHMEPGNPESAPGTLSSDNKSYLKVAAQDGWILVDELQMEGKKRMSVGDFLRGNSVT